MCSPRKMPMPASSNATAATAVQATLCLLIIYMGSLRRSRHRRGRQQGDDLGTRSGLGADRDMAARILGTLTHPDQAQTDPRLPLRDARLRVEAYSVVADLQLDLARSIAGLDLDPARIGMTHRVADGFLHDPERGDQYLG